MSISKSTAPRSSGKVRTILVAFLLFGAVERPLLAELKWDAQKIDLTPLATDATADAKFGFVNAGDSAVTIEEVKSCCSCTVSALKKKTYAPGERGELSTQFEIGERRGAQTAVISVITEKGTKADALQLNVLIPDAARMNTTALLWAAGDKPDAKTIELQAMPDQTLRILKVTSNVSMLKTRIETLEDGAKYRVVVEPEGTKQSFYARLNIETLVNEREKTLHADIRVGSGGAGMPVELTPGRTSVTAGADQIEAAPASLSWEQGAKTEAKTFNVRAAGGKPLKVRRVTSSRPNFEACLETVQESSEYRITVKPLSLEKLDMALITIEADSGAGKALRRITARISRPK